MADDISITDHFPQIMEALDTAVKQLVKKGALDVQAHMQAHMRANHQIDTGNMVNSAYTVTADGSTYPGSASRDLLDSVPAPEDAYTAYAAVAANYAGYQNYGTRFQPARPFAEPATAEVEAGFAEAVAAAIAAAIESAGIK